MNVLKDNALNRWSYTLKATPQEAIRLFCFPYAGGGGSIYQPWAQIIPAQIGLYAIRLPGRESRFNEVSFTDLSALVDAFIHIFAQMLDRPFAFFGHSLGALVAFEAARRLNQMGLPLPRRLFLSAHSAPQCADKEEQIHQLSDVAFIEKLRKLQGTPEAVLKNAELMALFLPIIRADFEMRETYRYLEMAPLSCPISVFGGLEDTIPFHDLEAWRIHTTGQFTFRKVPGNHFFLQSARTHLLQAIAHDLS